MGRARAKMEQARRDRAREKLRVEAARVKRSDAAYASARAERRLAEARERARPRDRAPRRAGSVPRRSPGLARVLGASAAAVVVGLVTHALVPALTWLAVAGATVAAAAVWAASRRPAPSPEAPRVRVADVPADPPPAAELPACAECGEPVAEDARAGCGLCVETVHAGPCDERHAARHEGARGAGAYR